MRAMFVCVVAGVMLWAGSCAAQSAGVFEAARAGDVARLKALIDGSPELVNARNEEGDTPLHTAATAGRTEAALYLIGRGADVEARNSADQSPLLYAAYVGDAALVDTLVARGAKFDYQDARGNSPFHFAARGGHMAVVDRLASKGARLDLKGNQGRTPLFLAAMNGRADVVKFLLARGAQPGAKADDGQTPMTIALGNGHAAAAEAFLDAGVPIEGDPASLGRYIHLAAAGGSERIVDALLAKGASLDDVGANGRTLLHDAAIGGCGRLARTMIARPGALDARDGAGKTALHYAVRAGRLDMIEMLLDAGADPNVMDADGRTPLHMAEDNVNADVTALLRTKGAREMERRIYRLERASARDAAGAAGAPLDVTYVANEGFLIARGDKKILIDATHKNPWNYPQTGERVFSMMLESRPPFDGIDLSIASHAHADHTSPWMTAELLRRVPGIVYVSNPEACDSVRIAAGAGFDAIAKRVVSVDPDWKKIERLRENGIDLEFFGVNHTYADQEPRKTLATVIDLDGIRLVHMADEVPASNPENYEAVDLAAEGIDVAFADAFFLGDSIGQHIMREHIKPRWIILMHSGPSELDDAAARLAPLHPNLLIFRDQLERRRFAY
jgi:ankyrin repeat protein/L-ascorbate metabolism protein UlaG (beta-lactamase superfamily)